MDVRELQRRVLAKYGIRVEPMMSEYVLRQLERRGGGGARRAVPVIGGEARTGMPMRAMVDLADLQQSLSGKSEIRNTKSETNLNGDL